LFLNLKNTIIEKKTRMINLQSSLRAFVVGLLLCSSHLINAQNNVGIEFKDDPVAAALDSLINLKIFDGSTKTFKKQTSNKYNFPPDSIPKYSELVYEARLAKLNAKSPIKLEYNDEVKKYIELYAVRKREQVSRMLGLAELYFPLFEEVLDKYDIPLELKYLAIVESALNPQAKSRSGAMGLWQFMYGTGKYMDMNITSYVDERCDPIRSTEAACQYLKMLHNMFGDWHLALAAYNAGPGTINKAIRRSGGKTNYWELRPYLPAETNGYVPAFIAVNYVMSHAAEHNLYVTPPKYYHHDLDTVKIRSTVTFQQLSQLLNIPVEEIAFLNPEFKRSLIPYTGGDTYYSLRLPKPQIGLFVANEAAIYAGSTSSSENTSTSSSPVIVRQEVKKTHIVKQGEHLSIIARKYNVSVKEIKDWNKLKSNALYKGQKLTIYTEQQTASKTADNITATQKPASTTATKTEEKGKVIYYTIKSGDTLWNIAQKHGVTVENIMKWNSLTPKSSIKPGDKIKIILNE
jgi:membrane-bound lytic murein transglycosylase D